MAKWYSVVVPSWMPEGFPFWPSRSTPLESTEGQLNKGIVVIDPSKIMASWLNTPYNPEVLVTRQGLGIFDKMKRDEQVGACLAFKKAAILAPGWEVSSPGDQAEDWEPGKFIESMFNHFPGGWDQALRSIMLGMDYGYSVTEKVYGEAAWVPDKKALIKLVSIKPHNIDFRCLPTGELISLTQSNLLGGSPVSEIPVDKCVVYSHAKEFENYYGYSDLVRAYRAWWVKDNSYKWFTMYLERHGTAPLFGMYNQNVYTGNMLEELKKIVKNIRNSTMGLIPRGTKDDFELWSQQVSAQSRDIFLSALTRFDADIGHSLLVPSLIGATTDSTGSGGEQAKGSYARSQTHFDLFMLTIEGLQRDIATIVNEQIVKQACDLNFDESELRIQKKERAPTATPDPGRNPREYDTPEATTTKDAGLPDYPVFKFHPMNDELELELYKVWKDLVAGQVVTRIPDDEKHIRSAFGFPENDNPVVEPLASQMPKPGFDPEGKPYPKPASIDPDTGKTFYPKEVPKEKQTKEMQQFADENDGVWVEVGDSIVCVDRA